MITDYQLGYRHYESNPNELPPDDSSEEFISGWKDAVDDGLVTVRTKSVLYAVKVGYSDPLSNAYSEKWFYCSVKDKEEIPLKIEAMVGVVFEILTIENERTEEILSSLPTFAGFI